MVSEYPTREPFFAYKAMRLMMRTCLMNDIGHAAYGLLTVVALTEDCARYRRAVTWYDEQLLPVAGFKTYKTLKTARDKAVKSGWLHYEHGAKGVPGRYWIIIPKHALNIEDSEMGFVREHYPSADQGATQETASDTEPEQDSLPCREGNRESNGRESGRTTEENREGQRKTNGIALYPNPTPVPNPIHTAGGEQAGMGGWDLKDSDLKDTGRIIAWMRRSKLVPESHENELRVLGATERAMSVAKLGGEPVADRVAYFVSLVRDGRWSFLTDADLQRGKLRHVAWSRANRDGADPLGLAQIFQQPD